jgi:putative drug exporter of the RND superfamily
MFGFLGQTVSRFWVLVLVGWVVLLAATRLAAPPWEEVAQDKEFAFLPEDAPSRRSEAMFAKAFPDDQLGSNVVLVLHEPDPSPDHLDRDRKFIEDSLELGLRQIAEAEGGLAGETVPSDEPLFGDEENRPQKPPQRSIIERIRTPNALGSGALLVSEDGQVLLVVVELTTEFLATRNWPTIAKIEQLAGELQQQGKTPPGVALTVTGSAVIGRDRTTAQLQSARATHILTVVLVIALLLLLYRAPLLALIPLATVFLAVQVALQLLAILAGAGFLTLFQGIEIYVTILAYGAGVDYCLFLTARYKEELEAGASPREAVAAAVRDVGAALTASAVTVIGGIAMMVFAQFGKFREAGIAIPLSLCLVLAATLTFSPSLLCLAGRWAFWPQGLEGHGTASRARWPGLLGWLLRPGGLHRGWEKIGEVLLRRPGTVWLASAGLMAPFALGAALLYNHLSYDLIGNLPASAPSVVGTRILQAHFPAGILGPVNVLVVAPTVDFGSEQGREVVARVTEHLRERREELGLADVRSLTEPLGIRDTAGHGVAGYKVPEATRREAERRLALEHYVTDLGERAKVGTRLELILQQSPFAQASITDLNGVEQAILAALPPEAGKDAQLYVAGPTASVRDLQTVVRGDRVRIELLVLASVFVILLLLLRQFVVPLYLLLSVLFSYYTTLGVSFVVFWLLDPGGFTGIDWKVAIFLFTILIAVGEDYNIFLMARVTEEEGRHGRVRGVVEALARTGPVISSCGIIMAGTFASLLAGSLAEMKQLGFALAFGVLLDTFVVRPLLVPAFLILLHGGKWKPAGWWSRIVATSGREKEAMATKNTKSHKKV